MSGRDLKDDFLAEMLAQIIAMQPQVRTITLDDVVAVADMVERDDQEFLDPDAPKLVVPKGGPRPVGPGPCPVCGARTIKRNGPKGFFYGCSQFPACRGSRNFDPAAAYGPGPCPMCGSPTVQRVGRLGLFYGCTKYPDCTGLLEFNPDDVPAPTVARKSPPPGRKPRPKVEVVPIEAPLQPELRVTVPPLSPELVEQPSTESDPFDEDEILFDD